MAIDLSKLKKPNLSEEGLKVLEIISKEDVVMKDLANMISQDAVLSATVIRYANGPMYRRSKEVSNVLMAINMLGLKNVRLSVAVTSMQAFNENPSPISDMVWEHSFGVSTLSKMIARKVATALADDIEFTALMHDMGIMVLITNFPEEYKQVAEQAMNEGVSCIDLEKEFFGYTHDEVMAVMADEFRLPEVTKQALEIFHTHEPLQTIVTDVDRHVAVVSLAHLLEDQVYTEKNRLTEQLPDSIENLKMCLYLEDEDLQVLSEDYEEVLNEKYMM